MTSLDPKQKTQHLEFLNASHKELRQSKQSMPKLTRNKCRRSTFEGGDRKNERDREKEIERKREGERKRERKKETKKD